MCSTEYTKFLFSLLSFLDTKVPWHKWNSSTVKHHFFAYINFLRLLPIFIKPRKIDPANNKTNSYTIIKKYEIFSAAKREKLMHA